MLLVPESTSAANAHTREWVVRLIVDCGKASADRQ